MLHISLKETLVSVCERFYRHCSEHPPVYSSNGEC